jgi:hypothetical protein
MMDDETADLLKLMLWCAVLFAMVMLTIRLGG